MFRKTTIKTILFMCAVILVASMVMQIGTSDTRSNQATKVRYQPNVTSTMVLNNAKSDSIFGVPDVVTTPLPHRQNVQAIGALDAAYTNRNTPVMGSIQSTPFGECQTKMTAKAVTGAMVDLDIDAACQTNAFFVVRHMGMVFSGETDSLGHAEIRAPALSEEAVFTVYFGNIESAAASLTVPDIHLFDHAILQWRGNESLQLHALEFGARIGGPGHILAASSVDMDVTISGKSGFMQRFGAPQADIPYMAEVYTFPTGFMNYDDAISLLVGVTVNKENCGRSVKAEAIQTNLGNGIVSHELSIPMPGCDAMGRTVVLPHMFQNLTLASR